jgi:hypothetical protein
VFRIVSALICVTFALTSHSAKATARVTANVASPAEPFSNIALSITEDVIAISSLYLVYNHPFIALTIVLILVGIILWFAPKVIRGVRALFRSVFVREPAKIA